MRTTAGKRLEAVTEHGRRRHYDHAASLACAVLDGSPDAAAWLAEKRDAYRRYPALQRAFDDAGG